MSRKVYIDLNGVLADMSGAIRAIGGERKTPEQVEEFFRKASSATLDEWLKVTKAIPEGQRLWRALSKYSPAILSSTGVGPQWDVHRDKLVAMKAGIIDHFYPSAEFISVPSKDKSQWAAGGNILVDDSPKKLALWESAGGVPILFDKSDIDGVVRRIDEVMSSSNSRMAAVQIQQRSMLQREAPGLLSASEEIAAGRGDMVLKSLKEHNGPQMGQQLYDLAEAVAWGRGPASDAAAKWVALRQKPRQQAPVQPPVSKAQPIMQPQRIDTGQGFFLEPMDPKSRMVGTPREASTLSIVRLYLGSLGR
jgi:hypothetical protein